MPTVVGFVESGCPFPVGFGGFFKDDPNSIYAGTKWEQKKDVFILAAGDTYSAGSTGGEAQHPLTDAEMPNHKHTQQAFVYGYPNWPIVSAEPHSVAIKYGENYLDTSSTFSVNGMLTTMNASTVASGGSQPHNNMPPYYSMPFWIRTA